MRRIAVIQTRYNRRPNYNSLHRTQVTQRAMWDASVADLFLCVTGDPNIPNPEWMKDTKLIDWRGEDCDSISKLVVRLFSYFMNSDYEFICFVDDDAHYRKPIAAMQLYLDVFDEDARVATTGPMGPLREFRRYESEGKTIHKFNDLHQVPWAPCGSQIYRISALREIPWEFLKVIQFRVDAPIAMVLYGNDFRVGESPTNMAHTLSCGLDQPDANIEFFSRKINSSIEDWEQFRLILPMVVAGWSAALLDDAAYRVSSSEVKLYSRKLDRLLSHQYATSVR